MCCRSVRVHIRADTILVRELEDGGQKMHAAAYFTSNVYDVDETQSINLQSVAADLSNQVEHFNSRGSGFILDHITKFVVCISKYRPLHGSSYLPTPQWLRKKKGVITTKNSADSMCFAWSILSSIYCPKYNAERVYSYRPYLNTLNLSGLDFPMPVKDIPKFEKQYPDISVNVLCSGDDSGYVPLYVSKQRNRRHHVNLFLIEISDEHGNQRHHYVWITNMSRLVGGRTNHSRTKHHSQTYVCNSCLHPLYKKELLERNT